MPSTIEIPPDIAAKVVAQADAQGLSVDDYLRRLIAEQEPPTNGGVGLSPAEKLRRLDEWIGSHDPDTHLLSDGAVSRESIYGDRG